MTKEPLTYKLWAKILAYFLLAVFACGLMSSVIGMISSWELNVYTDDLRSLKSVQFRTIASSAADNVLHWVLSGDYDVAEQQTAVKNPEYRVRDHTGTELWHSSGFGATEGEDCYRYAFVYRWIEKTLPDGEKYEYAEYMRSYDLTPEDLEENDFVVEAELLSFDRNDEFYWANRGIDLLWSLRYAVYVVALVCLMGFIACFVFLLCGAGYRTGHAELTPGYFYKVPFDLMTAALLLWCVGVVSIWGESLNSIGNDVFDVIVLFAVMLCIVLPVIGWCTSFAMRVKRGGWWKNTVIYRTLHLIWRACRGFCHGLAALLQGLPLVWKTAVGLAVLSILQLFWILRFRFDDDMLMYFWFLEKLILIPAILYLALMLRKLQKGGIALAAGDLGYQTDTKYMILDFKQHGENLNSVSVGMARAVEEQLKSERLKTELITNVSHDIKTPLTSIVNYVDLLKKNDDPERAGEFLDVLDRQSRKLKKLTEDLVEMSKASTGNIEVNAARHSINELLLQALGEYRERLEEAGLESVLTLPAEEVFAFVDGTLMWRVLDNLFSNACKYAQSGTRFYIDAREFGGHVRLSFKNISRERLNISADELMERFVRGDSARSGEGSGLGLNIARSLTELQGGSFSLSVDGDLFKANLTIPAAK